ncbi:hypothetical protein Aph01nite_64950 [Acrocarpospora phusangensis]|uniref:Transglycosylase SLT domain-containing protein n=1 Tax=Acrocarpospora phusangensis TaxID=1070424 RepID=A0A919QIS7_9ACTN|nr:lytic transglycosylase domain-containing protein [Acrocarpospora phusangensis]GIH28185.1 hypothetical protein Aph01nite_64950 [Acrocarpospora phusangensis]
MNRVSDLPWLTPLRGLVAGLAMAITVTVSTGSVILLVRDDSGGDTETAVGTSRQALVPDRTLPSAPPVVGGPSVQVTPPRLLAIAGAKVPEQVLHSLAKVKNVQKVAVVDGGTVRVAGTRLQLLAVDPAQFRSWTPKAVADHPAVWSALARGEIVADSAVMKRLSLVLGAQYQLDGGPRLRVAASAALGFPGVDGLIGKELGAKLGFAPGVVVMVHGENIDEGRVSRLLGGGTQLVAVGREPEPRQTRVAARNVLVGRPDSYLELYQRGAGVCPGLSWTVLAAIGQVESSHGRNNGPSSAGALGPMQFMPATWKAYGLDGDGDGVSDIWSAYDAVPSAANYLCANKAGQGGEQLRKAVWHYNHSWSYVDKVLNLSQAYALAYPNQ